MRGVLNRTTVPTMTACCVVAGLAIANSSPGRAGDWRMSSGVAVQETFSDNVGLAVGDAERNSELITQITPNIGLRGRGGRMSMGLNYSFSKLLHRQDTARDTVNNNLLATGQVEVWDKTAFIESQASISRVIVDNEVASSESVAGQNNNQTETRTVNITPVFRHHFGTWVETESRTTFSKVDSATNDLTSTRSITSRLSASGGRRFTSFRWSGLVTSRKVQNDGDRPSLRTRTVNGNLSYIVSPRISLTSSLGYETIDDSSLNDNATGLTWNAGFQARPSGKTSLGFTYGSQNNSTTINFNATHRLSERTRLTASFSQVLQTTQSQISDALANAVVDPLTGEIVDAATGLPIDGSSSNLGIEENTFRSDTLQISVNGSRRLTTFGLSASWNRRNTEATGITATSLTAGMTLGRTFNSRTSGNFGISLEQNDFGTDDGRVSRQLGLRAGLSYRLMADVSLTFSYNLTRRTVKNADEDLLENAVNMGFSKSF